MNKIKIGNYEFNYIIDDSVHPSVIIFKDPRTDREVGRIINIEESEVRQHNDSWKWWGIRK